MCHDVPEDLYSVSDGCVMNKATKMKTVVRKILLYCAVENFFLNYYDTTLKLDRVLCLKYKERLCETWIQHSPHYLA